MKKLQQKTEIFLSKSKNTNIAFIKKAFLKKVKKSAYISKDSMFVIYRNPKGSLCCIGQAYGYQKKDILFSGLTINDAEK